ncbi:CAMK family protein kinase [Tritrichomonas foetus]|uniref:CAMK family protein kinase n=1 Tax=Tritrichomonas foetus TaxID=1144522 RepID=A0A1J4K7N5_9EUKA|nr:CAMK family protein kinase [Tritrichomonas foetus]|eukprot:OHT05724.1 CAMK family protein kinase [Tritrichomonas foetus]
MIDDQEQMKENFPKIFGQYHFMRVIGRGAYGVVICAQDIFEQEFAVKVISREFLKSTNSFLSFEQELRVHQSLDHFNIVKIREVLYEPEYIYVVMDLCSRGDLFTFISEESPLPLTLIRNIFFQILQGVRYLHNRDIAHLDLKPDNILMTGDNIVKINDFGFCEAPPKRTLPGAAGTLYY